MKRKTIALLLLLLCVLNVNAQDDNVRTKSVYVEAFGPSNTIGITTMLVSTKILVGGIVLDLVSDTQAARLFSMAKRLHVDILYL